MSSKKTENKKTPDNKKQTKSNIKKYILLVVAVGIIGIIIAAVKYFGKDKIKRNSAISIEFTLSLIHI